MKWAILSSLVLSLALPVMSSAVPADNVPHKIYDGEDDYSKSQVRGANVEIVSSLEERRSALDLGSFPLAIHLSPNSVMFQVAVKATPGEGGKVTGSIKAICVEFFTTGNAIVTTTGVETDDSILGDFLHFLTNPTEIIVDALDLNLRLGFLGVTGHFKIDISFAVAGTYTVPIFTSESLLGIQLNEKDSIGLIFEIELVFTVTAPVDVITGFEVEFPDDTFIILNSLSGELVEENLKGIRAKSIPAKFKSGAGCFSVALRFKLKAGTPVEVFKFGFKFEAGAYIDAPLYKACITYQPDQSCTLNFTENFIIDVAVYAEAAKTIDFLTWAAGPILVSTLYVAPLPSTCFISTTSSIQNGLASSTTSNPITPTPELETTLSKSTYEIPSTTIPSSLTNSTISSSSAEESRSRTEPFPTNSSNSTIARGSLYGSDLSAAATGTHSGASSGTSMVLFPNSTSGSISNTRPVQTYGNKTEQSPVAAIKISSSSDSTITSGAPFPIATADHTIIVSIESKEHDDSTSISDDLPTITVNSTSTYTIYSCAKEAIWCPSTLLFPLVLTKTITESTATGSSFSSPIRTSPIRTISDQPSPTSNSLFHFAPLPAIDPSQFTSSRSALSTSTPTISITDEVTFIACPTPIIERIETTIIYSTIGISIAAYSPTIPQIISGSTWYVPGQSLWNSPGPATSTATTGEPGGPEGYPGVANNALSRRTGTATIEADLSRTKIGEQIPGKITETGAATGRRWTTSSTKTTVSSISRGGGG
ncbi:hypothetical protein BELL_0751g00040 [Botrytis elliptica]|uniref:Uncharacterized protein n=1 Tax=Botrytis elliptica TaxID=278938 RepID=A0A4Z1JES8_9HELO|nr:hypothetical protein EAE99_011388 [Botrytis elliptica]TGO69902.1 hypothetical protein BELL_0751g00040 [Botrytis elliptica]